MMIVTPAAHALQPLSFGALASKNPLRNLEALTEDPRLETCRQDLQHFMANLSANDIQAIQKQKETFEGESLKKILTAKVNKGLPTSIEIDDFMKGVSILIPHGKMKCQISIYPELDIDQIKVNIDPIHEDMKMSDGAGGTFEVPATLLGFSANATENSDIHFDPSKAMTILKSIGVSDLNEQIKFLGEFEKSQSSRAQNSNQAPAKAVQ